MGYIRLADMPVAPYAPTNIDEASRWQWDEDYWGDAFHQGSGNDKPGLSYTGMYPITFERLSDGETPGYRGRGMGELARANCGGPEMGQLSTALQQTANAAVSGLILNTNATGPITINSPFAPGQPAQASGNGIVSDFLAKYLQPAIYVQTPLGVIPFEPYGKPDSDYSAAILGFAVLGAAVGTVAALWILKRAWYGKSVIPVVVDD